MRSPDVTERHLQFAPPGGVSLLRASMAMRLGIVAVAAGLLWLAVLWALT